MIIRSIQSEVDMMGKVKYGFKMTPQRLAILEYLKDNKDHPSALDVFKYVSERFPTISFATVYNTLEMLKKKGMIREINIDPERKRFDPNTSLHHHLVCNECGRLMDFEYEYPLESSKIEEMGFRPETFELFVYGKCGSCTKDKK